jgi:glucosamine--fructose-6-phosphate aminotransferase (isomerizing)
VDLADSKYSQFALVREMMDTVDVVRRFDPSRTAQVAEKIRRAGRLMLTGEGSSRIFPAKNAIRKALTWGLDLHLATDGSRQAAGYDLSGFGVFAASNSGRTKEIVTLARRLSEGGNPNVFGLTANEGTVLAEAVSECFVLTCGWEQAVAATKSVVEQALFYQSILSHLAGRQMAPDLDGLCEKLQQAAGAAIDPAIVAQAARAPTIYLAGYNDGVAEELTLKTNEITRKKSDFLEGTYAVHGVEEVMEAGDVVFVVDPIDEDMPKFHECLVEGAQVTVVAISSRGDYPCPVIRVPEAGEMAPYVYLLTGWNLLVEIGLSLGINLDKPQRARKVGHEVEP